MLPHILRGLELTPAALRKRIAELEEEVRAGNKKLEESRQESVKLVSGGEVTLGLHVLEGRGRSVVSGIVATLDSSNVGLCYMPHRRCLPTPTRSQLALHRELPLTPERPA